MAAILGNENRASHYTNILHDLKGLTYTDIAFSNKIACENGLLDVETGQLTPFTLDEMSFYSIPVTFNPNIKNCDNWLEFLRQVVNPEDVLTLQEWAGYILLPDYRFHIALWVHGEGRNGKGVFDRTIQGIIGRENFSSIGLEELDGTHRFSINKLYGKLYNTSSEPTTNKIFRTEIFQKITGGDPIDAERKGKDERVEFVNSAKITIYGNKFPKIYNPTIAFKERMMFVKFPIFFDAKNRIPHLERVWLDNPEEKTAILNWMLDGLQRLLSQGYFTQSKTQQETEIEFQRTSNTIGAFQLEIGILDKNMVTTRADALLAYQNYCEAIGVQPESKNDFTQQMQKLAPKVRDAWTTKAGKKERAWIGFGLKALESLDLETKVTAITDSQQNLPNIFLKISKIRGDRKDCDSVTGVTHSSPTPEEEGLTANHCKKWHTGACSFPGDPNCVLPTNPCPKTCVDFQPITEAASQ